MRNTQEPVESKSQFGTRCEHPAYAMIGAYRVSGDAVLVGTEFVHHNFITVTIKRAELRRDFSRDWFFGRDELISVNLSEAQWATFVSSLNVGDGVSCTLDHVMGETMAGIPYRVQTTSFKTEVHAVVAEAIRELDELIEAGGLTRAKMDKLKTARMALQSNLPFVQESFDKHVEGVIEHAKIEVNAYMTGAINRAGIAALSNSSEKPIELSGPATE